MSIDKAISMEPVKEKLKNLREHMPEQDDIIYDFGTYLADRLSPELIAPGFVMTAELALHDLQEGVNGFTGQPISGRLVGYPLLIYNLLKMRVPEIAEVVCPKDFAKGVRDFYEQVSAKTRE